MSIEVSPLDSWPTRPYFLLMDAYKKFGSTFPSGQKVQDLKDVLKGQKIATGAEGEDISQEATEEFEEQMPQESSELELKIQSLSQELEQSKLEIKKIKDESLRNSAEFDNTRKRLTRESTELARFANEKLLREFLPIIDSLEMSLAHVKDEEHDDALVEGIRLTHKQFLATLEKFGLTVIEGEGEAFDPNTQEAIGAVETNQIAEGHVAQVHRPGYKLHERVVRPAMVTIAKPMLS